MPRYLYLLRHAQSADKQTGQSDKQRELTSAGVKQSLQVASYFLQKKTFPDVIVSSPATRAKATVNWIADVIKIDQDKILYNDELYEASTRTLFHFITQLEDDYHHVMCVGHNPAISYLAEVLTKNEIGEMSPASLAIIQLNINSWKNLAEGSGNLLQHVRPDDVNP